MSKKKYNKKSRQSVGSAGGKQSMRNVRKKMSPAPDGQSLSMRAIAHMSARQKQTGSREKLRHQPVVFVYCGVLDTNLVKDEDDKDVQLDGLKLTGLEKTLEESLGAHFVNDRPASLPAELKSQLQSSNAESLISAESSELEESDQEEDDSENVSYQRQNAFAALEDCCSLESEADEVTTTQMEAILADMPEDSLPVIIDTGIGELTGRTEVFREETNFPETHSPVNIDDLIAHETSSDIDSDDSRLELMDSEDEEDQLLERMAQLRFVKNRDLGIGYGSSSDAEAYSELDIDGAEEQADQFSHDEFDLPSDIDGYLERGFTNEDMEQSQNVGTIHTSRISADGREFVYTSEDGLYDNLSILQETFEASLKLLGFSTRERKEHIVKLGGDIGPDEEEPLDRYPDADISSDESDGDSEIDIDDIFDDVEPVNGKSFKDLLHTKGKHVKMPSFAAIEDSQLRSQLETKYAKARETLRLKRKERSAKHADGTIGKLKIQRKGTGSDRFIKLEQVLEGNITMGTAIGELKSFIKGPAMIMRFPPMDKSSRKVLKIVGLEFGLKVQVAGKGMKKHCMCIKTKHTSINPGKKMSQISREYVLRRTDLEYSKSGFVGGKRTKAHKAKPQHGEVVGAGAAEIGQDNVGRRLLENMGWASGLALGSGNTGILEPVIARVKHTRGGIGEK